MLRLLLATAHLLALGIGLGAVAARGGALREPPGAAALRRAFRADTLWGVAALLWIGTGLWRLLAGTEKPIGYYLRNHLFLTKMTLLAAILALEVWPMVTLVRWRRTLGHGEPPPETAVPARRIAAISYVQAALVALMVLAAAGMARGYGAIQLADALGR